MPAATDHACLHKTASRLNNLLQTISRSSAALEQFCRGNPDAERRFGALCMGVEGAKLLATDLLAQLAEFSAPAPSAEPTAASPAASRGTASPNAGVPPPATALIENPEGLKELILIIDDEQTIVTYVTETLKMAGYRVIGCTSPFDAIKAYRQHKHSIAIVILDYTLPIMNGQEVFDEILGMNPSAAVMLSSGFAEQQDVNAMLARGLRGFLPKPYTEERLLSQVRSTIAMTRGGNRSASPTGAAGVAAAPAAGSAAPLPSAVPA